MQIGMQGPRTLYLLCALIAAGSLAAPVMALAQMPTASVAAPAPEPQQIIFTPVRAGIGATPTDTDVVLLNYEGRLADGKVFDASKWAVFPVNAVVPGFAEGLRRMQKGGRYTIIIPPELAYGAQATGAIPPNSTLTFDVELLDFRSMAEMQATMQR